MNQADTEPEMSEESQTETTAVGGESFGAWLRSQREIREVDLSRISQTSKINLHYLEALEQDRFDLLPALIFVKGFLREYARIVGLDADEVLNFYLAASAQDDRERGAESFAKRSPKRSFVRTGLLLLAIAAILAVLAWQFFPGLVGEAPGAAGDIEPMAPPIMEEAPPPPPESPLPERALRVTLEFQATSWIDVYSDGERTTSELRIQGESLTVSADEEIRLVLDRSDAAKIEVNGEPFEHGSGDGEDIVITLPGA